MAVSFSSKFIPRSKKLLVSARCQHFGRDKILALSTCFNGSYCKRLYHLQNEKEERRTKMRNFLSLSSRMDYGFINVVSSILPCAGNKVFLHNCTNVTLNELTGENRDFELDEKLHKCVSTKEVFQLLNVQPENITGDIVTEALVRIEGFNQKQWQDDKNPNTTVVEELYEILQENTHTLSEENVVILAKLFMLADVPYFYIDIVNNIHDLISKKLEDRLINSNAVLSLVKIIQGSRYYDGETLQQLWMHLTCHYYELDLEDILTYFELIPENVTFSEPLMEIMEPHLVQFGFQFRGSGIGKMAAVAERLNFNSPNVLKNMAELTIRYISDMNAEDIVSVLKSFEKFLYFNTDFIHALERYISLQGTEISTAILSESLTYLCKMRYLSKQIMEVAEIHFIMRGITYSVHELFHILTPFGYFNYEPNDPSSFFSAVDKSVLESSDKFEKATLYKLIISIAWLGRESADFRVLCRKRRSGENPAYPDRDIKEAIEGEELLLYRRAMCSLDRKNLDFVNLELTWKERSSRELSAAAYLVNTLYSLFDGDTVLYTNRYVYYILHADVTIVADLEGNVLPRLKGSHFWLVNTKLITFILRLREHYCENTRKLLGEHAKGIEYLRSNGVICIELNPWSFPKDPKKFQLMLYKVLREHVKMRSDIPYSLLQKKST